MTISTIPTNHPSGTIAGGWQFTLRPSGITHEDVFSSRKPSVDAEVADSGEYIASGYRVDAHGNILGNRAYTTFEVADGDVTIETAGMIAVEVL